jgi:hypothetical protein
MLVPKKNCHPDRSEAKWRDLRFKSVPFCLKPNLDKSGSDPTASILEPGLRKLRHRDLSESE